MRVALLDPSQILQGSAEKQRTNDYERQQSKTDNDGPSGESIV
jgi:hypothetical protein